MLRARILLVLAVVVSGVAADQVTKVVATRLLNARAEASHGFGPVQFRPVQNRGAVLGIGHGLTVRQRTWLFAVLECALLAALVVYALVATGTGHLELWAVLLAAAGGLGNVIDRVSLGFVRDFILVGLDGWPTAAFNLADAFVAVGGVLLLAAAVRSRRPAARAAFLLVALAVLAARQAAAAQPVSAPAFPIRIVKLGGPPAEPRTQAHVEFCRKIGFNALWVDGGQAGRWTKEAAPSGPHLDAAFLQLARWCRENDMALWVAINPVAESHNRFLFADKDGERRLIAFAKKLRAKAGVTHVVVTYDAQSVDLHELSEILRYGPSAAPAHVDLVRRLASGLPPDTSLWLRAAVSCDTQLGDGTQPYAKAFLEGLPSLPPSVGIVWTGTNVASPSITVSGLAATRARLGGRRILLDDDFPANHDAEGDALALILGPLRDRDAGVRDIVAAYLACPMTELAGSRLSLLTTAAYLADPEGYVPEQVVANALDRLAGADPAARTALDTQEIEWGGWIDGRNYWPRDALNAGLVGRRLYDPAFIESFTWTAERYPGRMAALGQLVDAAFRADLLMMMRRRLIVAEVMPLAVEYLARKRAGRADAAEVLSDIELRRRAAAATPDAARILDLFLRAADVPIP